MYIQYYYVVNQLQLGETVSSRVYQAIYEEARLVLRFAKGVNWRWVLSYNQDFLPPNEKHMYGRYLIDTFP